MNAIRVLITPNYSELQSSEHYKSIILEHAQTYDSQLLILTNEAKKTEQDILNVLKYDFNPYLEGLKDSSQKSKKNASPSQITHLETTNNLIYAIGADLVSPKSLKIDKNLNKITPQKSNKNELSKYFQSIQISQDEKEHPKNLTLDDWNIFLRDEIDLKKIEEKLEKQTNLFVEKCNSIEYLIHEGNTAKEKFEIFHLQDLNIPI